MHPDVLLAYIMRWVHIGSAFLAIGVPFFVRFVLSPAASRTLNDDQHAQLRDALNARWRHIVYLLITLFIITGFYTFLVPVRFHGVLISSRWRDFPEAQKKLYHMVFGIKVLAAFVIFFLASALAGRTKTFAPIRTKRKLFLNLLLLCGVIVLTCAVMLRFMVLPVSLP